MSFTDKLQNSLGELVYIVRGEDRGRKAWHYVLVDKMKLPMFKKALASGNLDVSKYGKILYSGWGENPPQEITDKVKEQYS